MASKGKSQSGLSTRVTETSENQRVRHAEVGVVDVSLSLYYTLTALCIMADRIKVSIGIGTDLERSEF